MIKYILSCHFGDFSSTHLSPNPFGDLCFAMMLRSTNDSSDLDTITAGMAKANVGKNVMSSATEELSPKLPACNVTPFGDLRMILLSLRGADDHSKAVFIIGSSFGCDLLRLSL